MSTARARDSRLLIAVAAVASAWCVATLAYVLGRSLIHGLHFAGPYAGLFAGDQLRYLAWIRDAGLHGLIANPYVPGASHLYLQPVFLISGLLWRAGLSIQLAYLLWTPVALGTLIYGYVVFVRRYLSERHERAAALALALLFFSPLAPLMDYGGIVNRDGANSLVVAAGHSAPYWQAWGFLPTVIALGLMPLFVLGLTRPGPPRVLIATALAGALVAWLHPWGGIELVLVALGLLVLRRREPSSKRPLVIAAAVTALPLVYYLALAAADSAWSTSELRAGMSGPVWPLLFTVGPLLLVALPALRRRPENELDWLLVLWLGAVVVTYIAFPNSRYGALEGSTLPLAVLAVRGWRRVSAPRWLGWVALALAILPGWVYSAHTFRDLFRSRDYPSAIAPGEQRAVDALDRDPPRTGTVLATGYLGPALPALAGLLDGQVTTASNRIFDYSAKAGALTRAIETQRATVVVSDCRPGRINLTPELTPLGFTEQRYGCERIWRR